MSKEHRWLAAEIDRWIADGVITPEQGGQLRSRYEETGRAAPGFSWGRGQMGSGRVKWLIEGIADLAGGRVADRKARDAAQPPLSAKTHQNSINHGLTPSDRW